MPWWAWLVAGGALMAIELIGVDALFYLVFLGFTALVIGAAQWAGADLPIAGQWALYAVLSVASMVLFRKKLYERLRTAEGFEGNPINESVEVADALEPGASTKVSLRGTTWNAVNAGHAAIPAGATARVTEIDGVTLRIEA